MITRRNRTWAAALWLLLSTVALLACNEILGAELGVLRNDFDAGLADGPDFDGTVTPGTDTGVPTTPDSAVPVDFATIGGTVSQLLGTGLILKNNGADDLQVTKDGAFAFPAKVPNGGQYNVTVSSQPSNPTQSCTVTKGTGTVQGANIADIAVTCTTPKYTIGGRVIGLTGTGLVLANNGGDDLSVPSGATTFNFATGIASGAAFNVTIKTQPATGGPCNISGGAGTVGGSDVTGVVVNCTPGTFTVGGTVTGLNGSVVLQNNGANPITITNNGGFAFQQAVATSAPYAVTVLTQPSYPPQSQTCTVASGSGTMGTANVTNVAITCVTNTFNVGGTLSGVIGTLILKNNNGDDLSLTTNDPFTFATKIASGSTYTVTIGTQPAGQLCTLTNATGTVGNGPITNVSVSCASVSAATITLINRPTDPSNAAGYTFTFTITGGVGAAQCKLDRPSGAGTYANCDSNTSHAVSSLADGTHTFTVQATNAAGATSTAVYTWIVDKVAPSVVFTSTPGSPSSAISWTFTYTISGAVGNPQCKLDTPSGPGTFASCNVSSHTVSTPTNGSYTFTVRANDGVNTTDAVHTWTKCTPTAPPGPFAFTGGVVTTTVPAICAPQTVRIEVTGAEGGAGASPSPNITNLGGKGARMRGDFTGLGGVQLSILVGEKGESRPLPSGFNGGGGGGSFVWRTANNTLLVAAGGGGGGGGVNNTTTSAHVGVDGQTGLNGTNGNDMTSGAGINGNGGVSVTDSSNQVWSAGGAGWLTNGAPGYANNVTSCGVATGGTRPLLGGAGGAEATNTATLGGGGFGGGGGAQGLCGSGGGGGGGGYSGGGGGSSTSALGYKGGGGGGSFNNGTNQLNTAGARTGNGVVSITW